LVILGEVFNEWGIWCPGACTWLKCWLGTFVILEIMFLSIAGPIGTATGLDLDDLVMLILAINSPSYNRVDS